MNTVSEIEVAMDMLAVVLGFPKITPTETQFNCPFCYMKDGYSDHKHHLCVNTTKNAVHCFRCGAHMSIQKLCRDVGNFKYTPDEFDSFSRPRGFNALTFPKGYVAWDHESFLDFPLEYAYAKNRIEKSCFMVYRPYLGFTSGHVVFHDSNIRTAHWWMRSIKEKKFMMPSCEKPIYFLDAARHASLMVLAESPFGATAWSVGSLSCGVALIGKHLGTFQAGQLNDFLKESKKTEVCVALDGDAYNSVPVLCSRLKTLGVRNVSFIELGGTDADELDIVKRSHLLQQRKDATLLNLMRLKLNHLQRDFPEHE